MRGKNAHVLQFWEEVKGPMNVILSFAIGCVFGLIAGGAGMYWLFSAPEEGITILEKQVKG